MPSIVSLIARIGADSTDFSRELKKVERQGDTFQERFAARFKRTALLGVGIGFVVAGFHKVISALNEVIENTEEAEKAMQKYGLTLSDSARRAAEYARTEKERATAEVMESGLSPIWSTLVGIQAQIVAWGIRGIKGIGALLGGGWEGAKQYAEQGESWRYGSPAAESEAGRKAYMAQAKKRREALLLQLAEQEVKNFEESLSKEQLLSEKRKLLARLTEKMAGFVGRDVRLLEMKIGRATLEGEIADIERDIAKEKAKEKTKKEHALTLLAGLPIPKGGAEAVGLFAPGADLAGLRTIGEKQLVELRKISGAVVRGNTITFV